MPDGDGPAPIVHTDAMRRALRAGDQCLHGREAGADEQLELAYKEFPDLTMSATDYFKRNCWITTECEDPFVADVIRWFGDDRIIEQIVKHLNKLIDVIKVVDLNESEFVSRETALIKVHTKAEDRAEALRIVDIFRANIIDSTPGTYTIEVTGDPKKIEAIINLLQPLGIKELTRTGRVAVAREPVRASAVQPKKVARE